MKDLSARWNWNAVVVLLALATMLGCQALDAKRPDAQADGLIVTIPDLNFGSVVIGSSKLLTDTVVNPTTSSVTITQAVVNHADFRITGPALPLTLGAGQSATFSVAFTPHVAGNPAATILLFSNAPNPSTTLSLSGAAVTKGRLAVSPSSLSFGTVRLGRSQTKSLTLTNASSTTLNLSQVTTSGTEFRVSGLRLPFTLAVNQSANFSVTFTPKTRGGANGMLAVTSSVVSSNPGEGGGEGGGGGGGIGRGKLAPRMSALSATISASDTETLTIPMSGMGSAPGQLTATPASLSFGNVQVAASQTLVETVTNSGGSDVIIAQATVTGLGFSVRGLTLPLTLPAGQSKSFNVTFAPQSAGNASGDLAITSDASNPVLDVSLSGTSVAPGMLTATPPSLSFGSVQTNTSQTLSETLTNSGGSTVTITQATVTGAGYSVSGLSFPLILMAGQSTTFTVAFSPQSTGSATGNLSITSNASNPTLTVPLSGTCATAGALTASPASLSFGSVRLGDTQTLSGTLTNSGGSSVTLTQATVTAAGFSVSGLSLPLTLMAGQSKTFSVTFDPQGAGNASGNISITSNASNQTLNVPLSGTGITPGSLTASPASLSFGSVQVGDTQTLSGTLTNSGGSSVRITQATVTGTGFNVTGLSLPLTLTAGQSKTFSATFAPQSAGSSSGSLNVTSDASNPTLTVPFSGTGVTAGSLTASPASLSFGSVPVGNTQTLSGTLANSGGSSVTITQATVTGSGFNVTGLSLPLTLTAGQSKTFSATFTPQLAGSSSGSLVVTSDAPNPTLTVPLSGTGVTAGSLTASPASLSFGSVQVGNTQTLSGTITNSGGSSVTITQATVTGTGFNVTGLTLPLTLTAGQSKTFSATYTPQSAGSSSGNLAIASNASNSTLNIALSGTGVAPGSLTASPASLSFGSVQVGNTQTLSGTITNSGGSSVTITQATVTGTGFNVTGLTLPLTLTAGQSKTFSATFTPQSAGSSSGSLAITSNASNPAFNVALSGTGVTPGSLAANPSALSFGSVQVGSSNTLSEVVTNSGGSSVTITQANLTGSAFTLDGLNLPLTLTAGQSVTFSAVFTPPSASSVSGSLAVVSNASNSTLTISLSGTGTAAGQLTVSPATLGFGSVVVGESKSLTGTLSASGSSVTVSSASVSTSEFALSGLTFPFSLGAGQSKTFTVTFTPQSSGAASASASFVSNASTSPIAEALTGSGTPPPQHSVSLSWTPSTSSVVGYNIYRGTISGGPYTKINSALNVSTTYTDNSVQAGQTYFYVTTAVDAGGTESGFSNQVQAVIPSP